MAIHVSQGLLDDSASSDRGAMEEQLWVGSGGACALCGGAMDREADELEAGKDGSGGLHLSHARCHHDVLDGADREALEREVGSDLAAYLERRAWRESSARLVEPRVPLLLVGSERRWEWSISGSLADGSGVTLGCLRCSFEAEGGGPDEEGVVIEDADPTYWSGVIVDAAYPDIGFLTLTAHDAALDWVAGGFDRRRLVLESAVFEERIRLAIAEDADELAVRMRFTPAVQVALATRGVPEEHRWETDAGAVLVARWGETTPADLPELIDLLGDALWLRAVVADDPPGRVPDREALRGLALGCPARSTDRGGEGGIRKPAPCGPRK